MIFTLKDSTQFCSQTNLQVTYPQIAILCSSRADLVGAAADVILVSCASMDDLVHQNQSGRRRKKERLDPRLGPEIRTVDLQVLQHEGNNAAKIPGIIFRGVFLALAVVLLPVLHKQSPQLMGYANHTTIARSWELINLVVIGLAISYGLISRRPADKSKDHDDLAVAAQGTQNYVQKMFEFAEVFDNFRPAVSVDDKQEARSSRWQPEEPLVVFAGDGKQNGNEKRFGEQPLLLPIRSLKSSLSNPEVFDFLKDGEVPSSKPALAAATFEESGKPPEVRNGAIMSVESGNFDEELSNVIANDEPAAFPSPIPWASRLAALNNKEPHPPPPSPLAPAVDTLASDDGKTDLPAIPSPIPWRSRPDHDGKQKISMENGDVSECKPPLPPPQRPPPPPPEMQNRSIQKRVSPSLSPSPPRPPAGLANGSFQKNLQASSGIPLQKFPSPSPPRPRPELVENGSSHPKPRNSNVTAQSTQNDSVAVQTAVKDTPQAVAPSLPTAAEKHNVNGDVSTHKNTKDVVLDSDESKPRKASLPPPPAPSPPVFQDLPKPKKSFENGSTCRSDSRSKSRDGRSDSRSNASEGSSSRSDSRNKSRDALSHSLREIAEAELAPHSSRKFPSPPPPLPPVLPPTSISAPVPPPPPCPKDQDHTSSSHDELKHEKKASSSSEVIFQVGDSDSESEHNSEGEVDKKADQFIARFHEQIRLQRIDSIRRSQERRERRGHK